MELTPEEKQRIYKEEKAREEVRREIDKEKWQRNKGMFIGGSAGIFIGMIVGFFTYEYTGINDPQGMVFWTFLCVVISVCLFGYIGNRLQKSTDKEKKI